MSRDCAVQLQENLVLEDHPFCQKYVVSHSQDGWSLVMSSTAFKLNVVKYLQNIVVFKHRWSDGKALSRWSLLYYHICSIKNDLKPIISSTLTFLISRSILYLHGYYNRGTTTCIHKAAI